MGQKVSRVIRACVELGEKNPIISIHDQGAGGNGNVLKEIVEPAGARIGACELSSVEETLLIDFLHRNPFYSFGRSYTIGNGDLGSRIPRERCAFDSPRQLPTVRTSVPCTHAHRLFASVPLQCCYSLQREDCPYSVVGVVTGHGCLTLHDEKDDSIPLDLNLVSLHLDAKELSSLICLPPQESLSKMPRKTFTSTRLKPEVLPLSLPLSLGTYACS